MSHGQQVSPPVESLPNLFRVSSPIASSSNLAPAVPCFNVLLVGRNGSWGGSVLRSLERLKGELSFASPNKVTSESVRKGAYRLILLDSTVPPEQRRLLASELIGSETSIFYTFPVEHGCWWLPALHRGQDCHGAPAFRRNEFPFELERILRDQPQA